MAEETGTPKKRNLLSELAASPEGKLAMLQAGLSLMAGPRPGEGNVSTFGRALGEGVNTYQSALQDKQAQEQQQMQNDMAQQELQMNQQLRESQVAQNNAQANYYTARTNAVGQPAGTGASATGAVDPDKLFQEMWKAEQEAALATGGAPNIEKVTSQWKMALTQLQEGNFQRYMLATGPDGQPLMDRGLPVYTDLLTGQMVTGMPEGGFIPQGGEIPGQEPRQGLTTPEEYGFIDFRDMLTGGGGQ